MTYRFSLYHFLIVACIFLFFGVSVFDSQKSTSENLIQKYYSWVVMILSGDDIVGSGSVLDADRWIILTSKHIFWSNTSYTIQTHNGQSYPVVSRKIDAERDIALIAIRPDDIFRSLPSLPVIASQNMVQRGDAVYAFWSFSVSDTVIVSAGIVSDVNQKIILPASNEKTHFIQTDIQIMSGFSGWPLVHHSGYVIGVHTAGYNQSSISWSTPISQDIIQELLR